MTGRVRLGGWAVRAAPVWVGGRTPVRDLALLDIPVARFHADKVVYGLVGLAVPPLLAGLAFLLEFRLPFPIPAAATLVCGVVMFVVPDLNVREAARGARAEFVRALAAYVDLVALERRSGSDTRQAMEVAATVGDSWVFTRLADALALSRWTGQPPWSALRSLADELAVPELGELADVLRLSGEEGAQVYTNLRARSAALRQQPHHHRPGPGQRGRGEAVHPDQPARRDLPRPAPRPRPPPPPRHPLTPKTLLERIPPMRHPTRHLSRSLTRHLVAWTVLAAAWWTTLTARTRHDQRGSTTIETVAWAVGIIAIVLLALAAIRGYVTTQIARL